MEKQRLDKLIAATGQYSRRDVKALVRQGRVLIDDKIAAAPEDKYDGDAVEIKVDGKVIACERFTWLMLNKPAGYLSATEDGQGETVLDLLPAHYQKQGLFPVGRLDKDTEGLLLLTNDGQMAHRLLSPRHHVDKRYFAKVDGILEPADCQAFSNGMTLGDGLQCMAAKLEILEEFEKKACFVTLQEGKFHQVKRMLACCGKPVTYLQRVAMGGLKLDENLALGAFRPLTKTELTMLERQ
ncbi:pseudouridine synthase [Bengtsoniella intestinalis]|uniref:pseudouridine synthase n=1 Tax=Bengtsoniella intestinalis TaxID=3073143 RepID=UPI00391EEB73